MPMMPFPQYEGLSFDEIRDILGGEPREPIDANGVCRIYHGCLDRANSCFPKPENIADTRHIEFHFHMQPDVDRMAFPTDPSVPGFRRECPPIWYFVDEASEGPKPSCTIIITFHGVGELPRDYSIWLNLLLALMSSLTLNGFEDVVVKVVPGFKNRHEKRLPPSEASITALASLFKDYLGMSMVDYIDEEWRMDFRPRLLYFWPEQPPAAAGSQAASEEA